MLKLNVGFNRKVGEANYGSRGASVNLDIECEGSLASDPERLKERIRQLFALARASVDEELNGQVSANGNGRSDGQPNSNGHTSDRPPRPATASQLRALRTIADRHKLNLSGLVSDRYGLSDLSALSISQASELIDELKAQANGNGTGGRR